MSGRRSELRSRGLRPIASSTIRCQHTVDDQIARVLDALRATGGYENTIVVFSSDHGDMLGAHGGMHEKWHNAYEESIHVPFVVAGPMITGGAREVDIPTNHADLIPTLMGFAGIDPDAAREQLALTTPMPVHSSVATSRHSSCTARSIV